MPDLTTSRSTSSTGSPARAPPISSGDLAEALALGPEHLSCYELEAKPGTRFTHAHGEELARQAEAMEGYFELVVDTLVGAGYRWYETANFCRDGRQARHNLAYWLGRDYLGLGVGAVSTVAGLRWRNTPKLARYLGALRGGPAAPGATRSRSTRACSRRSASCSASGSTRACPWRPSRVPTIGTALGRLEGLGLAERRGERPGAHRPAAGSWAAA